MQRRLIPCLLVSVASVASAAFWALGASALAESAPPAPAPAPPLQLEARTLLSSNRHMVDDNGDMDGAINRRIRRRFTLKLLPDGKLWAEDTGSDHENVLDGRDRSTEDESWTNTWSGTWSAGDGTMALELTLDKRSCGFAKTVNDSPTHEKQPCPAVSPQVRLTCKSSRVSVVDEPGGRPRSQDVWSCGFAAEAKLAHTPRSWVFGKKRCLEAVTSRRFEKPTYMKCGR